MSETISQTSSDSNSSTSGSLIWKNFSINQKQSFDVCNTILGSTQEQLESLIIKAIVAAYLPFSITEIPEFSRLLSFGNSFLKIPKGDAIKNKIDKLFLTQKKQIISLFEKVDAISICSDVWSSPHVQYQILGVTTHFQLNGTKYHLPLDLIEISESHTAEKLSKSVFETLQEFNLHTKLVSITTDNGSNMIALGEPLKRLIQESIGNVGLFRGNKSRIRCLAHTFNLPAQTFSENSDIKEIIMIFKRITKVIRKSGRTRELFRECCELKGYNNLITKIDVCTRFVSKLEMVENMLDLKPVINYFFSKLDEKTNYYSKSGSNNKKIVLSNAPTEIQWDKLQIIKSVLEPFGQIIRLVSAEDWYASNSLPAFNYVQEKLKEFIFLAKSTKEKKNMVF
ncbi:hypothetical protein DLAC_09476 [Tieghemostelium lacteum]|uniref:Uncharacterized protein n=1 Tax=Tieghemostelium lacteum TaxID=361077 RepID=A0A151Z6G6_TIELA|nr:hypothetical protein DLAC_09476 [Tieghemostelium lacteum]|eukprot:KYQ89528.1 hypothetical protein DLAC_09476 [Tieghemostelium lacteum]